MQGYKNLNSLINEIITYQYVDDIIKKWMFGDIKITKSLFNNVHVYEQEGYISERIISHKHYEFLNNIKVIKYIEKNDVKRFEKALNDKFKEFFYTENLKDIYLDMSLNKWKKAYVFFYKFIGISNDIILLNKNKLMNELKVNDFRDSEIESILKCFTHSISNC